MRDEFYRVIPHDKHTNDMRMIYVEWVTENDLRYMDYEEEIDFITWCKRRIKGWTIVGRADKVALYKIALKEWTE